MIGPSPAVERVLAALATAGCEPRREGKGWRGRCPAHPGKSKRSLKIDEGDDGRALIYCFAGCAARDVVSRVGIDQSDLFIETRNTSRKGSKAKGARSSSPRPHVAPVPDTAIENGQSYVKVAAYEYTLDDGTGAAVKVRYERDGSKTFRSFEIDSNGGFWSGLGGKQFDLYVPAGTPAVEERASFTVILSEGEKATDRCAAFIASRPDDARQFVAVGTHGSKSFHGPDGLRLLRQLEGFGEVVAVVDRDNDGDQWSEDFRRHAEVRLPRIRFVRSRVDSPAADLFDHLEAGFSFAQLLPLAEATGDTAGTFQWHRLDVRDAIGATPRPIPWRIGGIGAKGEEVVLTAPGGLGKTYFLMQIAMDAALGRPALGIYPISEAIRVLWIDEEMGDAMLSDRLTRMVLGSGLDEAEIAQLAQNLDIRPQQGLSLGDPDAFAVYDRTLRVGNYGLVVIDSLVALNTGEENKGKDARGFYQRCIAPYKGALGTTFLTAAHPVKPNKDAAPGAQRVPRGSGDWFNQADRTFWLEKQSEDIRDGVHVLKVILHRDKQRTAGSVDGHLIVIDGPAEKPVSVRSMGETGSPAAVEAIGKVNACQHEILTRLRAAPELRLYQPDLIREIEALGYDKKHHYYPAVNGLEAQRFVKIDTIAGSGRTGKWVELKDSDDAD